MQDEEIITEESLVGAEQDVPASTGEPAVSVEALTLEELNRQLGKNFPNIPTALKALKDTQSYVGRKIAPAPQGPQVDLSQFVPRSEFEESTFYAQNPDYRPHSDLISALAAKHGKPLHEVVQLDSFKNVFEKVKTADAIEASKSVLHTNPRLGHVTDKISQAREALKAGDQNSANRSAVESVLGAFEA